MNGGSTRRPVNRGHGDLLTECLRLQAEVDEVSGAINKSLQYIRTLETFWGIPDRIDDDMNTNTRKAREELVVVMDKIGLAWFTPESEVGNV